jgi:hypothetical protein
MSAMDFSGVCDSHTHTHSSAVYLYDIYIHIYIYMHRRRLGDSEFWVELEGHCV